MTFRRTLAALCFAVVLLLPGLAAAQRGYEPSQRFRCESRDGRTSHCSVDTRGGVVLVRQLSRGACIEGRTWGWDRGVVWVSQGCRAEFETGRGGWDGGHGGPGWGGGPGWSGGPGWGGGQRVTCESRDQRTSYCDIDTRGGVVLVRQLSRGACIEGRTWGWDRRGVWVSQGCRAEFETGRGGGPGWNDGPGWGGGHGGPARVVRCESRDGRTQYCDIGFAREARLERQLSRGACIEGQTWGWDRRGLWVTGGCRGEFSLW